MDTPLTIWYCDVCGQPINDVSRGYLIWKSDENHRDHGFKIIHQRDCDRRDHGLSGALRDYLGPDGLARLLAMVSLGPLKGSQGLGVANMDEWVDLVRRLHTPHYEEARRKFREEAVRDAMSDANETYPYVQDSLKNIIQRY